MVAIHAGTSSQMLIGEALKTAAHFSGNREAFIFGEERLTYHETLSRAETLAGWLQEQGIKRGSKVGCLFRNGLPFIELYFASSLCGAVFVPVNFRLAPAEIEYIVNQADVEILFIEPEFSAAVRTIQPRLRHVRKVVITDGSGVHEEKTGVSYRSIFSGSWELRPVPDLVDDDPHAIIFTSGTTGKPKGAVLTHKNIYINGMNKLYHSHWPKGVRQLVIPPLFHVAALSTVSQNCLLEGTSIIQREFDPKTVFETIESERINTMFLVPAMWNFLLQVPDCGKYDVSSMVSCAIGGAICPLEIKKKIINLFKNAEIMEAFGQTEMSPSATYLTGADTLRKTDSVGRPSINVRVRIVDDEMNDVPQGEIGEIVYQGPTVMKEYYKNEEATSEAFRGGWFHSGDLVRMDEEGFIYVIDRKKDMLISGGENIYPKEIEEVLYSHPDILEAAVIGVPDADWGESVKAFIVAKPGRTLAASEVIDHCKASLASYKKPKYIEFIEELPRNASGKVLKTALREPADNQKIR